MFLKYLIVGSCLGGGTKFVSVLQPCITHHAMKIVLNYRTLFRKAYTCLFISQAGLGIFKPDVSSGHAAVIILSSTYFVFQNDAIAGKT